MPLGQFDESIPLVSGITLTSTTPINTDETVVATLPNRARFDVLIATNTDTVAHTLTFYLVAGATRLVLGNVQVPIGAGSGTVVPLDVLTQLLGSVYHYLTLPTNVSVVAQLGEAITATKVVSIFAMGGNV